MSYINVSTIYRAAATRALVGVKFWRYQLGLECQRRLKKYDAAPYEAAASYADDDGDYSGVDDGVLFLCLMAAIADDRRWRINL